MAEINISICIPAYKRIDFLKRLLDSVAEQLYKNYEVVITDDSNNNDVEDFVKQYADKISQLKYFKNSSSLGSPENWNECIRKANGKWIKLMHDDDWLEDKNSLQQFADAAEKNESDFIFSGFYNNFLKENRKEKNLILNRDKNFLKKNSCYLLKQNFIGHPSTTLIKNNLENWYENKIKWVVDIEFYIRVLDEKKSFYFINKPLINIGIGDEQITREVFRKPEIEIPENIYLINKLTTSRLRAVFAYDYFWRFLRNLSVRSINDVKKYTSEPIPEVIQIMIKQQSFISPSLLKIGIVSKTCMFISYLYCRFKNIL